MELLVCPAVLDEIRDVLSRPRLRNRFASLTDNLVQGFISGLATFATTAPNPARAAVTVRDLKDQKYLDLAGAAGALFLVSRDNDLLSLRIEVAPESQRMATYYPLLKVLDPVAFLLEIQATLASPIPPASSP